MNEIEEVIFKKDKMQIYGQIYIPNNDNQKYPAVIIGHCFGGSYKDNIEYAKYLSENGYATCIFDFCGGSNYSKSDGSSKEMSVLTEVDDMECVLEGIKKIEYINSDEIFLMGESQGGYVAALLASRKEEEINGLIMLYPALSIVDDGKKRYKEIEKIPDEMDLWGVKLTPKYYTDIYKINIYEELAKFKKNVIIFHGDEDKIVDISYSKKLAEAYQSAELVVCEGAKHRFTKEQAESIHQLILNYLDENSKKTV